MTDLGRLCRHSRNPACQIARRERPIVPHCAVIQSRMTPCASRTVASASRGCHRVWRSGESLGISRYGCLSRSSAHGVKAARGSAGSHCGKSATGAPPVAAVEPAFPVGAPRCKVNGEAPRTLVSALRALSGCPESCILATASPISSLGLLNRCDSTGWSSPARTNSASCQFPRQDALSPLWARHKRVRAARRLPLRKLPTGWLRGHCPIDVGVHLRKKSAMPPVVFGPLAQLQQWSSSTVSGRPRKIATRRRRHPPCSPPRGLCPAGHVEPIIEVPVPVPM